MSVLDSLADRAQAASQRLAGQSGFQDWLSHELADDAVFLRKLKPRLVAMRAKAANTSSAPAERSGGGPGVNPYLVAGMALLAGIAVAKLIDWRGHAHPRW